MGIEQPRTGSAARHGETRSPIGRPGPGNRSAVKAVICPAIALAVELVREAGMSRLAAEIETPSAAARKDTTDRAHEPVAAAVHPAWDLEAPGVVAVFVVVDGADNNAD